MTWSLYWNKKVENYWKFVFLIKTTFSRIDIFNFENSYLNYIYTINCLIKPKNRMISKLPLKKIPKSCFNFVFLTKKFKERN